MSYRTINLPFNRKLNKQEINFIVSTEIKEIENNKDLNKEEIENFKFIIKSDIESWWTLKEFYLYLDWYISNA